jgi:protein-S-isoprenylcysteine O-methyltransferase Ste14
MAADVLTFNRVVVFCSAIVYWAGVCVQARRVRKRIGRSPNVRPKGLKEKALWTGWSVVVLAWMGLPFLSSGTRHQIWWAVVPSMVHPVGTALGVFMMGVGYAGTLWCYKAMGNAWRMGIDRKAKTDLVMTGPYRFVRHPIYLFQIVMVAGIAVLLPSLPALLVLAIHVACAVTKATDEEKYLRALLGHDYEVYCASSGGWLPKLFGRKSSAASTPEKTANHLKPAEQRGH